MSDTADKGNPQEAAGVDPEIAELMGIEEGNQADGPAFNDLFGEQKPEAEASPEQVDLSKKQFPVITKREGDPQPLFTNKNYYKIAMNGEAAKRFHGIVSQFLAAKDPQEKSMHRGKLISAYWNLAESISLKTHTDLPLPKTVLLRFGAAVPTIISAEQRAMLSKVIFKNDTGEPIHYLDEWFSQVATGQIGVSATDEVKVKKQSGDQQLSAKLEKARGQKEVQLGLLTNKLTELEGLEKQLVSGVGTTTKRESSPSHPGLMQGYREDQRAALTQIGTLVRQISNVDKEVAKLYEQLDNATLNFENLKERAAQEGVSDTVDSTVVQQEFNTVRQMAKLCVGRQGNHTPFLMKQYLRSNIRDIATRENVIIEMAAIEEIDPGVFERTFKRQTNRIVPYIILVPCYGDIGTCWEPFAKFNRATSRGRVAIPMYPKDVKTAVITALADLRWQVAKEKAQHYWMEEGLTGMYYQWFSGKKMRGDVREFFLQDYVLWITKESEGTQKLDKEVRGVFWRHIPFKQDIKDKLRDRGFAYSELYKKDVNRGKSDGY